MLGVDSVIEGNNDVIGSESGAPMDQGPGKGSMADLTDLAESTGDEGAGEGLNTDAERGMSLAIIVVDIDRVPSTLEGVLVVGEPRGYRGKGERCGEGGGTEQLQRQCKGPVCAKKKETWV